MSIILASMIAFGMDIAQKTDILAAHNRYRAEVNVTPLAWSDNRSAQAQKCADYNAALFCPLEGRSIAVHRNSGRYSSINQQPSSKSNPNG